MLAFGYIANSLMVLKQWQIFISLAKFSDMTRSQNQNCPKKKEPRASQRDICLQAPAHFHPDVNCNEANAKILQNKLLGITKENKVRLHPEAL